VAGRSLARLLAFAAMVPRLVLASASPRRRDLLSRAGLAFDVQPTDVDETPRPGEAAEPLALRLAEDKAAAIVAPGAIVLAADTIVVRDAVALGKPRDEAEAAAMLRSLSGRRHEVITAFAAVRGESRIVRPVRTEVVFRDLSEDVIARYVATGEPMDKAGSYGIQGIGAMLVERVSGSYTNVVGLPLVEVLDAIAQLGGPRR
jgi:septum formation protein